MKKQEKMQEFRKALQVYYDKRIIDLDSVVLQLYEKYCPDNIKPYGKNMFIVEVFLYLTRHMDEIYIIDEFKSELQADFVANKLSEICKELKTYGTKQK